MLRKNSIVLLIIIAIFAVTLWVILPLRSSVELTYQAQFSANITAAEKATIIDEGVQALEQRIKNQGIRNYEIIRQGNDSIQVVLSDYSEIDRAKTTLGQISSFSLMESALNGEKLGRNLQLGLDLAGGVKLQYEAIFTENTTSDQQAAMDRTMLTISKRIDQFGVTEPLILQMGSTGILIELPGFTDFNAAKSLVEQAGYLEFREVEKNSTGSPVYLSDYLADNVNNFINTQEKATRLFVDQTPESKDYGRLIAILSKNETGLVFTDANGYPIDKATLKGYGTTASWVLSRGDDGTPLTGSLLDDALPNIDQTSGEPEVDIKWNDEGAVIFDQIALRLYNPSETPLPQYSLGIFLDNRLLSDPQMRAQKFDGKGTISGSFTISEAEELANLLKSGSLPVPLKSTYQRTVSATLGAGFINKSWMAGLIGLGLVMLFMIAYYRLPGLMASLALIFYATLTLAICKLWPITLSLGSIGGIIVSMGIAVDANVLIFERMKEEFRAGRTLGAAIEAGFHRAWSAIWDSNMTTFIACIILFWLGNTAFHNGSVIGFAVTLFVGAIVSMFTAVLVTRTLLRSLAGTKLANKTWLFTVTGGKK
jgi:protein-export membrane protein SecD